MNKKIVIIGVAALLLLAGGGAAAFFMLAPKDKGASVAEAEPVAMPDPFYVKVATLMAPVLRNGRLDQYFAIGMTIEATDEHAAADIEEKMPRLRDAFLREMSANALEIRPESGTVDIEGLRARLIHRAAGVMGEHHIKTVLIGKVLPVGS